MKCRIMLHFIWVFTVCKSTHLGVSLIQRVNPYPANIFCPENVVCFLRLLLIFKCTSDWILSCKQTICTLIRQGEQFDLGTNCFQCRLFFHGSKQNVCFLHLLHIFKCTSDWIFFMQANTMYPDQTAPLGAV